MKMISLPLCIAAIFFACAAFAASAEAPEELCVRGEAIVMIRVPDKIRCSGDRRALFREYCLGIAAAAEAEPSYISPVYESSECVTAVFKSKLETQELIERLKNDERVAAASPNRIMSLPRPIRRGD